MHQRNVPFLRLLLPFALGLGLGGWLDRSLPGLGWALVISAVLTIVTANLSRHYRHRGWFGLSLHLMLILSGYAHVVEHNEVRAPGHFSNLPGQTSLFIGTVYDAPARGSRLKVPLRLEAAGSNSDSLQASVGHVLLFVTLDSTTPALHYGDRLIVRATVRPTEPPKNPQAFDYQRYLHFQNLHYQAFVKSDSLQVLSSGHGYALWRIAYGCRDRLLDLLRQHFPTVDEFAVASALLVGYKDDLSDDLRTAYAETGSMHALAVSGTHVGVLYAGLLFLLKRLRWRGRAGRWAQTVLILAAIWGFTFLTGATASVLRASLMFSTFLLGKALSRDASIWNILAASAFGLLVLNPYFLFDAGFQLSYAAVAGMVFFYPRLRKFSQLRLPPWAEEGGKIFLIGVAAQLGTLPLSLYYFHQFPCYFWLAGWVVVLGGAVFLWGGAVLVLFDWLSPALAGWLGKALYGLVWGMNQLIFGIQKLPGSVIAGVWLPGWAAALLYLVLGLIAVTLVTRRARWLLASLSILLVLGIGRAGRAFERFGQVQVIVYHVNKHRLVDFISGETAFTLADSIAPRQVLFAAQANRWAAGIRHELSLPGPGPGPGPDTVFQGAQLFVHWPFIQFFEQKIAVIDDVQWVQHQNLPPLPVDVLLLTNNVELSVADCQRQFPCRLVVLDTSNGWKRTERWKAECRALGLVCHDVREQGAWVW